jgi:hypothetical protein
VRGLSCWLCAQASLVLGRRSSWFTSRALIHVLFLWLSLTCRLSTLNCSLPGPQLAGQGCFYFFRMNMERPKRA